MLNIKKLFKKICAEIKSDKDWIENQAHAVEELAVYGSPVPGSSSTIKVPNASNTTISTITLPKGRWFVEGFVRIDAQSDTKIRVLYITEGSAVHSAETMRAAAGTRTMLNVSYQVTVGDNDNKTLSLNLYQNSGKTVTIDAAYITFKATRISTPAE